MARRTDLREIPLIHWPAFLLVTGFGSGLLPKAPGTWGSLLAIVVAWALPADRYTTILVLLIVCASIGCVALGAVGEKLLGRKDPESFVLDELAGQWLALLGAVQQDPLWMAAGFVLFRMFDIRKPLGIARLQRLPGGVGILVDDLAAGALAALLCFAARLLIRV